MIFRAISGSTGRPCDLCDPYPCVDCHGRGEIRLTHSCPTCSGQGKRQVRATWTVEYAGGTLAYLCRHHAHIGGVAWECACGEKNVNSPRCRRCTAVLPDSCRKCNRKVGESISLSKRIYNGVGLIRLTNSVCGDCDGSGKIPCKECAGRGLCGTCLGQGKSSADEDCATCSGDGKCLRCGGRAAYRSPDESSNPIEPPVSRDPEILCTTCNGVGRIKRSKESRGPVTRIDLGDIPAQYHAELEPYIGSMICWVCASPDIVVTPWTDEERYCPLCETEGHKIRLNGYNQNPLCEAHTSTKDCRQCGRRLELDEPGVYCRDHAACLKCGAKPEPWSVFCVDHKTIRGLGGKGNDSSRLNTARGGNPADYMGKVEKLRRIQTVLSTRLRQHRERYDRLSVDLKGLNKILERLDRDLEVHKAEIDHVSGEIQEYRSLYARLNAMPDGKKDPKALHDAYYRLGHSTRELEKFREAELALRTEYAIRQKRLPDLDLRTEQSYVIVQRTAETLSVLKMAWQHMEDVYLGTKFDPWIVKDRLAEPKGEIDHEFRATCEQCRREVDSPRMLLRLMPKELKASGIQSMVDLWLCIDCRFPEHETARSASAAAYHAQKAEQLAEIDRASQLWSDEQSRRLNQIVQDEKLRMKSAAQEAAREFFR